MYEMLYQPEDTGVTKVLVSELKARLGLINTDTGQERYTKFK